MRYSKIIWAGLLLSCLSLATAADQREKESDKIINLMLQVLGSDDEKVLEKGEGPHNWSTLTRLVSTPFVTNSDSSVDDWQKLSLEYSYSDLAPLSFIARDSGSGFELFGFYRSKDEGRSSDEGRYKIWKIKDYRGPDQTHSFNLDYYRNTIPNFIRVVYGNLALNFLPLNQGDNLTFKLEEIEIRYAGSMSFKQIFEQKKVTEEDIKKFAYLFGYVCGLTCGKNSVFKDVKKIDQNVTAVPDQLLKEINSAIPDAVIKALGVDVNQLREEIEQEVRRGYIEGFEAQGKDVPIIPYAPAGASSSSTSAVGPTAAAAASSSSGSGSSSAAGPAAASS